MRRSSSELDELGPITRGALERLLPGPVTVLLANPRRRYPLAGGGLLGVRVPDGGLELGRPLLQSSANLAGGPDPRRLGDVPPTIRAGADLVSIAASSRGSRRPSSTSRVRVAGDWRLVRVGALSSDEVYDRLR